MHHLHALKLQIALVKFVTKIATHLTESGADFFVVERVNIQREAVILA